MIGFHQDTLTYALLDQKQNNIYSQTTLKLRIPSLVKHKKTEAPQYVNIRHSP